MKKILFTGAHHNSALALLDWMKKNTREEIEFIWIGRQFIPGSNALLSAEYAEVLKRNIKFYNIKAGKFYRFTNPRFFVPFLKNLFLIPVGFFTAFRIILAEGPNLIISFGGYISVPVVIAGWFFGIKSVLHEQTLTLGLANKISLLFTDKVYTAWPVDNYPYSYRSKMSFIGLPLRESFIEQISSKEKINFYDQKPVIYVTGGKNGSHTINKAILGALESLTRDFNIIWASGALEGKYDYKNLYKIIKEKNLEDEVLLREYFGENEIGKVFNTADIIVSRSGAHTVYEIIYTETPSILIPIPWSSNNEQYKNAKMIEKSGLGKIVEEKYLTPELLLNKIDEIYGNIGSFSKSSIKVKNNSSEEMGNELLQSL